MEKKMRGIADPFTLGLVIALLGGIAASTAPDDNKPTSEQSVNSAQLSDTTVVVLNQDVDE
jgi:hypothetical protein